MLKSYLGWPLVLVSGLRRTGKTSLVLSVLEEAGVPYLFFDMRSAVSSWRELYKVFSRGVSDFISDFSRYSHLKDSLMRFLKILRGISISGVSVEFSWGIERPSVAELLNVINSVAEESGVKVLIVFDEFQRVTGVPGSALQNAIAYAFDHLRNLSFVLSGSEMGLVYKALKNTEAPLYGRAYLEVKTRRLSRDESIDFLEKGFSELNYTVAKEEIEEVANKLDGIIGWLTYYGYSRVFGGKNLESVWAEAVELAKKELENFLESRVSKGRYKAVLRLLANGVREWSRIKNALESAEGKPVSDRVLHEILYALRNHSIINEENRFLDPLVEEAARSL